MASTEEAPVNPWFDGSVATAVETANTKGSVLMVCLIQGIHLQTRGCLVGMCLHMYPEHELTSLPRYSLLLKTIVRVALSNSAF